MHQRLIFRVFAGWGDEGTPTWAKKTQHMFVDSRHILLGFLRHPNLQLYMCITRLLSFKWYCKT